MHRAHAPAERYIEVSCGDVLGKPSGLVLGFEPPTLVSRCARLDPLSWLCCLSELLRQLAGIISIACDSS